MKILQSVGEQNGLERKVVVHHMEKGLGIPKSFKIFGQTITIAWDEELVNNDDAVGQARYRYNMIALQPSTAGKPRTKDQLMASFWHEVFHFLFYLLGDYAIGKTKLRKDEKLVDMLAQALYQVLTSADGELEMGL